MPGGEAFVTAATKAVPLLQWVVDWRREWTGYELEVSSRSRNSANRVLTLERTQGGAKTSA